MVPPGVHDHITMISEPDATHQQETGRPRRIREDRPRGWSEVNPAGSLVRQVGQAFQPDRDSASGWKA